MTNRKIFIYYPLKRGGFKPQYFGKADFIHKMNISLKEAREANYWLKILIATEKELEQRLLLLLKE
ncbi:four helix bundle protein [Dapis sp. BLCC M126]|uniref:four helix bundle protein n=1 Tax=Dapis sp. BLCC M126 TaxID=3400189 RepID=UPI003CEAF211